MHAPRTSGAKRSADLRINGYEWNGRHSRAPVYPGARNPIDLTNRRTEQSEVCVTLTAPDGRTVEHELVLDPDETATIDLGPFAVPAAYEYEAGMVFRIGHTLTVAVTDTGTGEALDSIRLHQPCSRREDGEELIEGDVPRVPYDDGYIPDGSNWEPFSYSGAAMEPVLNARLLPGVLADQDDLVVSVAVSRHAVHNEIDAVVVSAENEHGSIVEGPVTIPVHADARSVRLDPADWTSGTYEIHVAPQINERPAGPGPRLRYVRRSDSGTAVRISPFAPFELERDAARREIILSSFEGGPLPAGWGLTRIAGRTALTGPSDVPYILHPEGARGTYAVFVDVVEGMYVEFPDESPGRVPRRVAPPTVAGWGGVYVGTADLSDGDILVYGLADPPQAAAPVAGTPGTDADNTAESAGGGPNSGLNDRPHDGPADSLTPTSEPPPCGLLSVRLVPITETSAAEIGRVISSPPYELRGVDDWWVYFDSRSRVGPDQLDALISGQREIGLTVLNWAIGRSWVQYHTKLPDTVVFPCVPLTPELVAANPHQRNWERLVTELDPYAYAIENAERLGVRIQAWLGMNRHYNPQSYGGVFSSPWIRSHPKLHRRLKDGTTIDRSRVEYFFPEVRRERLAILTEALGYRPEALMIGWCRQPPHAGYHQAIIEEYRSMTGVDPRELDCTDGEAFTDWLSWRCGGTTELTRAVRKAAAERGIRVGARVPCEGLYFNMAEGMDVRRWVEEGLVDELQLDPLEDSAGHGCQDVRPYVELGKRHGVRIIGGVNGTTALKGCNGSGTAPSVGLRRAIGLCRAGVAGIEIYEAELLAIHTQERLLVPLWADPDRAERFLSESNVESVYPITATTAALGHDNHWGYAYSLGPGRHSLPRGAKELL